VDAKVDGIILKDSWSWTLPIFGCRGVEIENVKICSARCENNDGIGVCNSQNVRIANCFVRTDDDCITTKGIIKGTEPYPPVEDVKVENCVLWVDRAHVCRLGCECRAEVMHRFVFQDIDIIHYSDLCPAICLQPAEDMLMEDVHFKNIRINGEGQPRFIEVYPKPTQWATKMTPGMVRNITFKDISISGIGLQRLEWG
jgi:polygalacturonase